jgi:adenosine deaminase
MEMERSTAEISLDKTLLDRKVLASFPKVELHRHLEGTFPIDSLFQMSLKNNLSVPKTFDAFKEAFQFPRDSKPDFLLFLSKFKNFWYKSLDDISFITHDSVTAFKEDNLKYIELRFSPEHFSDVNNFDRLTVINLVMESAKAAAKSQNIMIRFLLTFNRNKQNEDEMLDMYKKIVNKLDDGVVGIDLAGDEMNFPPELYSNFFKYIHQEGRFKIDIHAGEVTDSKNIWTAVKQLHADRIGHGVSTIHDPDLQSFLIDRNISLCQCITSNYQTGAWVKSETHPLGTLYRRGVPISINSDDPSIQDSTLTDDYYKAVNNFKLSFNDLVNLNITAINHSFLSSPDKLKLKESYLLEVSRFKASYKIL